ncbi:MAG: ROK family protein [Brevinema sp.]
MRIGIDVGGTHTDAVLLDNNNKLHSSCKVSTSENVVDGIKNAIEKIIKISKVDLSQIDAVMLGSTHCINAILQRKDLAKVGIIRISAPASTSIPPLSSWPEDLKESIGGDYVIIDGGFEFDGSPIAPFNEDQAKRAILSFKDKVDGFAVIGAFSAVNDEQELKVGAMIKELTDKPFTLSSHVGSIGLLERENATIFNVALKNIAERTINSLIQVLQNNNLSHVKMFFCQNDGTLMSLEYALKFPIFSIACGPTNSIRGASIITEKQRAIIVDVGGTSTDIGIVIDGFPRESALSKDIGGCRTNFRMPDLVSIGLGGGSIIRENNGEITVGPDSVAYQLTEKALIFGGDTMTTTDIAVRLGMSQIGDPSKVSHISEDFALRVKNKITEMLIESIEQVKPSANPEDIIFVGGGSIIVDPDSLKSLGQTILPENYGVANAIGAASANASGEIEKIYSYDFVPRDQAFDITYNEACSMALKAGADKSTLNLILKEEVPLAYLPGNAVRLKVKVVGTLKI